MKLRTLRDAISTCLASGPHWHASNKSKGPKALNHMAFTIDGPQAAVVLGGILQSHPEADNSWWVGVQEGAVLVHGHLPSDSRLLQHEISKK